MHPVLKCKHLSYHRNGISGVGFFVGLFDDLENGQEMVVVRFPGSECRTAALSTSLLSEAGATPETRIGFALGNSWRGDHYEGSMIGAITAQYEKDGEEYKVKGETLAEYVERHLKDFLSDD